jgi:sialidase-1
MPLERFIINRDDAKTQAWPDLALADNGELICVFTECAEHVDRSGSRLCICKSSDRGRSWGEKTPLTDHGTKFDYYNNARINNIKGTLVIVADRVRGKTGNIGIDENLGSTEVYAWASYDNGKSWDGPHKTGAVGICPDRLRMTKSGRIILAAHKLSEKSGKLEQYLWYSDDKGKSWSDRVTVGADARYNLCEGHIVETEDGTLVAFMRENSGYGEDCMKAISRDGGQTWDGVYHTTLQGCHRPTIGYLSGGELLITYRYMQGGDPRSFFAGRAQNVFAALLPADQLTETARDRQSACIMPLDHDRNRSPDLGYTGWVELDDGEIVVAYYIKDDAPRDHIRGVRFRKTDIVF